MYNIQWLTQCRGVNKYIVKYIGKIDEQNYIVVFTDAHKNGTLVTKGNHLHNTKVTTSKINENKMKDKKRDISHVKGRAISLIDMIKVLLKYLEVYTDLKFTLISTRPYN